MCEVSHLLPANHSMAASSCCSYSDTMPSMRIGTHLLVFNLDDCISSSYYCVLGLNSTEGLENARSLYKPRFRFPQGSLGPLQVAAHRVGRYVAPLLSHQIAERRGAASRRQNVGPPPDSHVFQSQDWNKIKHTSLI